jgi:hypothetical protein
MDNSGCPASAGPRPHGSTIALQGLLGNKEAEAALNATYARDKRKRWDRSRWQLEFLFARKLKDVFGQYKFAMRDVILCTVVEFLRASGGLRRDLTIRGRRYCSIVQGLKSWTRSSLLMLRISR